MQVMAVVANVSGVGDGVKERGVGPQVEATVESEAYALFQSALQVREEKWEVERVSAGEQRRTDEGERERGPVYAVAVYAPRGGPHLW